LMPLGEWGLVDWVKKSGGRMPAGVTGPGDDGAVLPWKQEADLVVTTDLVAEGTHFFADADPVEVGAFAAAVNLSDLAAMGAQPRGMVAACGAPETVPDEWFQGIAKGLWRALQPFDCPLVGGDMKTAPARIVTGTAFGAVPHGMALLRSGAKPGDVIVATGRFGGPGAALRALEAGRVSRQEMMRVVFDVQPRIEMGIAFRDTGAHAAVDTSDGLARALALIGQGSGLAVEVDLEAVPLHPMVEQEGLRDDPEGLLGVLAAGGEYELLAAVAEDALQEVLAAADDSGVPLSRVGVLRPGSGVHGTLRGDRVDLGRLGWRHR
jgi:thiamine-monophosphate kinase